MPGTAVVAVEDSVFADVKGKTTEPIQGSCAYVALQPALAAPPVMPIEVLLSELRSAFNAEKSLGFVLGNQQDPVSFKRLNDRVQTLLQAYTKHSTGDWKRFALFNELHYVRNLVEANDDFELIVLCWKGSQVSRVHNHAASHCWLAVLGGEMREVQYQRVDGGDAGARPAGEDQPEDVVYVEATKVTDMQIGDVGYINDTIALHTVGCYMSPEQVDACNAGQCPGDWRLEGGVTLHLYSPPIRRVKIYEDNTVKERIPGFYSRGGVRV